MLTTSPILSCSLGVLEQAVIAARVTGTSKNAANKARIQWGLTVVPPAVLLRKIII